MISSALLLLASGFISSQFLCFVFKEKIMLTREEELIALQKYIENNGVTKLPPDERLKMSSADVWRKTSDKKKRRKSKK